jgi:hypothetical protein
MTTLGHTISLLYSRASFLTASLISLAECKVLSAVHETLVEELVTLGTMAEDDNI